MPLFPWVASSSGSAPHRLSCSVQLPLPQICLGSQRICSRGCSSPPSSGSSPFARECSIFNWKFRMSPSSLHPKWWQLYLTFPLLIALFALDSRLRISSRGHEFVQIGIILIMFGLFHLWLKANRSALLGEDREQPTKIYRVIEIPPARSPELEGEKKSILQLSDSE